MNNASRRYAKSTKRKNDQINNQIIALALYVIISLIGIYFLVVKKDKADSSFAFFSGFVLLISTFIYAYMEDVEVDWYPDFNFAKRVWLTTLLLSPIFLLLINIFETAGWGTSVYYYLAMVVFSNGTGVAGMVALMMISIYKVSTKHWKMAKKKLYIFFIAEIVLGLALMFTAVNLRTTLMAFVDWLVYALVLGFAIGYFEMNPIIYSDESEKFAEIVD